MFKRPIAKKTIIRIVIGILFIIGIGVIWSLGLHKQLTFTQLKLHAGWLKDQVIYHYWRTVFLYIVCYLIVVIAGLPLVGLMSITGGLLFGIVMGIVYIVIAATIGATLFFILVRYVFGMYFQKKYALRLHNFNYMIEKKGWIYLLILRCIAIIPFFMVNIFAALTKIPLTTFVWTTSIGILPTSYIFTYAGSQLNRIGSLQDFFSSRIMIVIGLLLILIVSPLIINKRWKIF